MLTCIKSTCDDSLDTDLLLSPLELTCDLAGVPISSSVVSSALQAATTTAVITSYITNTVTQSYYWQSTFATIASTIVVPITESNGRTVIVGFPVTIEPSTTIYGSPSTSTPAVQSTAQPTADSYFGSCDNPGIIYGYGSDGLSQYGFKPADQTQFSRGASPDIADVESFICNQLRDTCHASAAAQRTCNDAFNAYSGLAGQNAADVWNIALGLPMASNGVETVTLTSLSSGLSTAPSWTMDSSLYSTTMTTTESPIYSFSGTLTRTVTAGSPNSAATDGGGSPFDTQSPASSLTPRPLYQAILILVMVLACIYIY